MRAIYTPDTFEDAAGFVLTEPARFIFPSPMRGGPPIGEIRKALAPKGKLRFSGTEARTFADIDPGPPELPVVALDMIARSDAKGLQRAILSALPFVDEIVVGIDARSDAETRVVAEAFADTVHVFEAKDIGLTDEQWAADEIHFANARNIGRARVKAPWVLMLDTDDYVRRAVDFREALRAGGERMDPYVAHEVTMNNGPTVSRDPQRLAETKFRWWSKTHNQLAIMGARGADVVTIDIVEDRSLRTEAENERRTRQRNVGVEGMRVDAAAGNISAIFHLAKHLVGLGQLDEGARLAEDYRSRLEPHGPFADDRAWLALRVALGYYQEDNFLEAERWALRVLLDGPRVEAFCLLGDIYEDQGDMATALVWYEIACVTPSMGAIKYPHIVDRRVGRRDALRLAVGCHPEIPGQALTPEGMRALADRVLAARGRQIPTAETVSAGPLGEGVEG